MRLRAFALLLTLALGLLAAPLVAEAQQAGKVYRIGWLGPTFPGAATPLVEVFRQGLHDLGYVEGQNLAIEYRPPDRKYERYPDLVADLVRLKVDVILAVTTPATQAAVNATKSIPIVFTIVTAPVEQGFVASLARPGGNATGLTNINSELAGKYLELLMEVAPGVSRVAILWDPRNPGAQLISEQIQAAAQLFGLMPQPLEVRDPEDFEPAFDAMSRERAGALVAIPGELMIRHQNRTAQLALEHQIPTIALWLGLTKTGGLMSYRPSYRAMFLRAASYVDKILKGARPADLPVEWPTKFELAINLKTAKAL
ncbi:MAG: ABC transporter substrate-binding protein, partial [Alphaproteobacteria bacterium]